MDFRVFDRLRSVLEKGAPSEVIEQAITENEWFTEASIHAALKAICAQMLDSAKLSEWTKGFRFSKNRKVGVIMAGNIPLVGFYDLLAVLVSGAVCYVKPSSKDRVLMRWCTNELLRIDPLVKVLEFDPSVRLDAVIATGSDNSNRYFASEYAALPLLTRGSRFSVAVIDDTVNEEELLALWGDVFTHYGLGCRNVSHLFIPDSFDVMRIVACWQKAGLSVDFEKYRNNYTYTKAEKVMNEESFVDGGYFMLTERMPAFGALSEVSFSRYLSTETLKKRIDELDQKVQCVVSREFSHSRAVKFGQAQSPALSDYPDSKNILAFLAGNKF